MEGKVKKLIEDKGYGFIAVEDQEDDLFFHVSDCINDFDDIDEGDVVEFDLTEGRNGDKAINVQAIEKNGEVDEIAA